jgi:hypothetical protein
VVLDVASNAFTHIVSHSVERGLELPPEITGVVGGVHVGGTGGEDSMLHRITVTRSLALVNDVYNHLCASPLNAPDSSTTQTERH